ncbi:sugar ABC transporter substrate-binding protein [Cryptosporangium aurantiacum]|uniref:sugar ABC transporter substrate-binding protein n=1 Tax=Cryptosporangium aurantiacum TaxID=134849 RepID=UPI0015B95145|nr:substrate-binding domain-containing protein [Cryptosporangium aurantiacum]
MALGLVLAALLLSACSGGASDSASTSSSADTEAVNELFKGTEGVPPATSPPPAKGKEVWWISCGQRTQACKGYAAAGQEAAKAMGWNLHVIDGNLNEANGYATAMRTALAARPDAIVESSFSCSTVQPELQQAKQLGIPVIGVRTVDCNDAGVGPSLFTVPMIYSEEIPDNKAFWTGWGAHLGEFITADSGGKAKIITAFGQGDPQFKFLKDGFDKAIGECADCEVVAEVPWTTTDLAPNGPWVNALRNALTKHPDADYVAWPFDTNAVDAGGAKAVLQSGSDAKVISGIGTAPGLDLVRAGQIYAEGVASDSAWFSWAAIDQLNRHFNKQPSVPQGIGYVSIDKDHNLPSEPGKPFTSKVDFRSLYKKAWGVG